MRFSTSLLLVFITLILSSCDVNSSHNKPSTPIEVQALPAAAGNANINGNQLQAKAKPGFLFRYWEIHKKNGTLSSQTDHTITVNKDSVEHVKAVFGPNDIEYPFTIKADPKTGYGYYVTSYIMPVDTATKKQVYAFVRADLKNQTKRKIFITEKKIRRFDISSDNQFIAFSSYSTGQASDFEVDTYIYDLQVDELRTTHTGGIEPLWANTSNKLLIGSKKGVCIYDMNAFGCQNLDVPETSFSNVTGFKAAAWSPDDKHLLLSRDTELFYLYDTQTLERQKIASKNDKNYFVWLDTTSFITNGIFVDSDNANGFQYSLQHLQAPKTLSYQTYIFPVTASPSKKRLAIINHGANNGINIYDSTTDKSTNILNYVKYDPILLTWVQQNTLLFYGRNQHLVLKLTPDGNVNKL